MPHTPGYLRGRPDAPVFDLRVGSLAERDLFEARLDGEFDAGPVYDFHLRGAAIDGVRALGGDDADQLAAIITAAFDGDEPLNAADKATFDEMSALLLQHWPEYRALRHRASRRARIIPSLAFMTWCAGWRNVTDAAGNAVEFARTATGAIDEDAVRRIPDIVLTLVGAEAVAMQYGRGEEKLLAALRVRREPGEFRFGRHFGDGWVIGGVHWPENPAITVPRWAFAVVDLWMRCRAAGNAMIGGAVLPGAGGMTDQPAALIDAFDMLDATLKQEQADARDG